MFTPPGVGYDRAVALFSPDGRLFQVEYAHEAVRKGSITIGIKTAEGVILAAEKRQPSLLAESAEKIKRVDDHIGLAFSGLFGDARVLIDDARVYAQIYRLTYGEKIPVELLAKRICDIKQVYTQHGGVRPFGVAFLIAGVDRRGVHLIMTDPGGSYMSYKAAAVGANSQAAMEILEQSYDGRMTLDEATLLALKVLDKTVEGGITPAKVEMGIITVKDQVFKVLQQAEIANLISGLKRL
ncbi:MAG: archaeal proteasome endopeptidase complex subunit alpha [Thermofilaceae archaeon]